MLFTYYDQLKPLLLHDTWITAGGHEYLVVVVADCAFLSLDIGLADATSCHLFAVLSDGTEQRTAACYVQKDKLRDALIFNRQL